VVDQLRVVQDRYRSLSTELTIDAWRGRSRADRALDNLMRLTATVQ
jgi:cardiolipin synthase